MLKLLKNTKRSRTERLKNCLELSESYLELAKVAEMNSHQRQFFVLYSYFSGTNLESIIRSIDFSGNALSQETFSGVYLNFNGFFTYELQKWFNP